MIITKTLDSTAIDSIEYDTTKELLTVRFCRGAEYIYPNIPNKIVDDLIHAPSAGKFFNQNIKQYASY